MMLGLGDSAITEVSLFPGKVLYKHSSVSSFHTTISMCPQILSEYQNLHVDFKKQPYELVSGETAIKKRIIISNGRRIEQRNQTIVVYRNAQGKFVFVVDDVQMELESLEQLWPKIKEIAERNVTVDVDLFEYYLAKLPAGLERPKAFTEFKLNPRPEDGRLTEQDLLLLSDEDLAKLEKNADGSVVVWELQNLGGSGGDVCGAGAACGCPRPRA